MKGRYLEVLSWKEAEHALGFFPVCVLPVGARLKEHGLHLPLNNDFLLAEYFAKRLVEASEVAMLPTLPYGYYPAFRDYPGSTHVRLEAFRDTVIDIARSLARHGARRFYVLNTGISTNWALEPARQMLAEEGIRMDFTDLHAAYGDLRARLMQQEAGTHADEIETSMMLYLAPDVVRMDRAERDIHPDRGPGGLTRNPDAETGVYSPTGAWGDPTLATREKGEHVCEALVKHLVEFVAAFGRDDYVPAPPRQKYLK